MLRLLRVGLISYILWRINRMTNIAKYIPGSPQYEQFTKARQIEQLREEVMEEVNMTEFEGNAYVTINGIPTIEINNISEGLALIENTRKLRFEYKVQQFKPFPEGCSPFWCKSSEKK